MSRPQNRSKGSTVAASVNFDNLRSITGGDSTLEAVLFASFVETALACMEALRAALISGDEGRWRQQAHAFKGVCLNLGAGPLSDLCGQAQMDCRAAAEEKRVMLQAIEDEFAHVRQALGL